MIGCLRTRKQPIIALYFEFENELKFYNLEARSIILQSFLVIRVKSGNFGHQVNSASDLVRFIF